MNKRKIFFCGLIGSILLSGKVFAADFYETDPSSVAGYYFSEELSFVFMDNGIVYDVNPEHMEKGVLSENYTVSSDGNNYLVKIQDDLICLSKQTEKAKADNGGVYYALYSRYEGNVNEITYQEGAQVLFDDYIFDNDYEVIIREPLANFFSVEGNHSATIESRGYKSPEAAVTAYIEGFRNNDIDQMISTFAVETYVKNFDLEKYVKRIGAYSLGSGVVPSISEYADKLNLENRRSNIIGRIRNQYMTLTEAKAIADDTAGIVVFDFSEMTAEEFVKDIFTDNDEKLLSNIGFDGIFIAPQRISETYATENNRNYLQKEAERLGADKIESVVAFLMINDSPYLLCMDTVCYDDIWYALNLSGNIGAIIGSDRYNGGLIKLGNAGLEILLAQNDYGKYVGSQTETDDQKEAAEMEEVTEAATEAETESEEEEVVRDEDFKAALVIGVDSLGDGSFNDSMKAGMDEAVEKYGITYQLVEPKGVAEFEGYFTNLSASGEYDLIVASGFDADQAITNVAKEFPEQKYLFVDSVVEGLDNVTSVTYRNNENAYLLGVIAAMTTKTNKLGAVLGIDTPSNVVYAAGFMAGAYSVSPDVEIDVKYVGSFSDVTTAKELAMALNEEGADIVYAAAGNSDLGVFSAAKERGFLAIGTDTNQCLLEPDVVMASGILQVDVTICNGIGAAIKGTLKGGSRTEGLVEGALTYTNEGSGVEISGKAIEAAEKAREKIITGQIIVPDTYEAAMK